MNKKHTSKITNTQIEKSIKENKKVNPDEIPNTLYFGANKELDHLDTPAFLSPYKGIAQLFTIRKDDLITTEDFKKTIFKYKEWETSNPDHVNKILETVEIYHNNADHPRKKVIKDEIVGYIHHIDVSNIKDQVIEVSGSTTEREVLYIGKDPLPIKKMEKCSSKVVYKYQDPKLKQNSGFNDSRVQYEGYVQEGVTTGLVIGGTAIVAMITLIMKLIKTNSTKGISFMDGKIQKGESNLIDQDIRKMIVEMAKNIPTPILFVKGIGNGVQDMKLSQVRKLAGNNKLNCANPNTLSTYPDEGQVILIDILSFKKKAKMTHIEEVKSVFNHELGHIKTWKKFDLPQREEYFLKSNIIQEAAKGQSVEEKNQMIRVYYELPLEVAANKSMNVNPEILCKMIDGYKETNDWKQSSYYKFTQQPTPSNILKILTKSPISKEDQNVLNQYYETIYKEFFPHMCQTVKQESVILEADISSKRKQIEDTVIQTFHLLDPTDINKKKYQEMFSQMSDMQFQKWIIPFLADHKSGFRWDIEEFGDGSRTPKFDNIDKAASMLGIKLFEYVYIPHVSSNPNRPIRTKLPVLVGKLPIKRPQQFVSKKTNLSLSDTNRDDMTGIVKGDSKAGTSTGIENELLQGVGGDIILKEIIGARADNQEEYANMIQQIAETGSVSVQDIKTSLYDKGSLLKADLYLMAMGIKTDLISESYYSLEKVRAASKK